MSIDYFFGASQISAPIGADYYDAEYYATQTGEVINISDLIGTGEREILIGTSNATGCIETGSNGTGCGITGELKTSP